MKFLSNIRRAFFSKGYDVVKPAFKRQRRGAVVETRGEDRQLTTAERNEIVNLHRDMLRNSPLRVMQDQQLRVNSIGTVGGKLYASFPESYAKAKEEVTRFFNRRFFNHAEFTFGKNFNWLLKTALTAQDSNGNIILVFDDGILTGGNGTGRIRGFEGDEIASIPEEEFHKRFPKSYTQSEGFVYNESGVLVGAFVSTSQRGKKIFDKEGGFLTLKRDPFNDDVTPNWVVLGDMRRFNQGRAVSPVTSALPGIVDTHEMLGSENQAAKLNSQLVYQILKTGDNGEEAGFAGGALPLPGATGGDAADAAPEKVFDVRPLKTIGAVGLDNPDGVKVELLDTKHPNANFPNYIDFQLGVSGGTRGLARVYSTLKAQTSYTAFRGEQVMTQPTFEEIRKDLERDVCDWAARLVIERAVRLGLITAALPEYWYEMIAWAWPTMREVSVKEAEAGRQLKLQNGVTSLTRELGPGEMERVLEERKREKALFDAAGLVYPGETTASGQIKGAAEDAAETEEPNKEATDAE